LGQNGAEKQWAEVSRDAEDHEVLQAFAEVGFALNATLKEMLNEHHSHRTERRGAGFTQATRHLATFVNCARVPGEPDEARMFLKGLPPTSSRSVLRQVSAKLEREESRILSAILIDLALPVPASDGVTRLPGFPEDLKIGTCPLAEKYFLEIAEAFVRRKGLANVLVSDDGEPVLLEKLNLGDDHSCISVAPVTLNGVRLPPGSLFGVKYEGDVSLRPNRHLPGNVIPIGRCSGFRFLRLSTLAVSPRYRERAFTAHFQAQVTAGLFAPREATVEQLRQLAQDQL
jgi:hypothetical protein